jgi:hypothetical protein
MEINKIATKTMAGLAATGTLMSSCNRLFISDTQVIEANLPDKGLAAINVDFSKKDIDYLNFLDKLGNDIIKNPVVAREFVKNPQLFVERYGYNEKVDLDEGLLKLVVALGDENINNAIVANDVATVLTLMKEKGLLDGNNIGIDISDEQKREMLALLGIDASVIDECIACMPGICYVPIMVIAYIYVGAVAAAVAETVFAAHMAVAISFETWLWGVNNPSKKINS